MFVHRRDAVGRHPAPGHRPEGCTVKTDWEPSNTRDDVEHAHVALTVGVPQSAVLRSRMRSGSPPIASAVTV